jgi:hypothetical protein
MNLEDVVADLARAKEMPDPADRAKELTRLIQTLPEIGAAIREARQQAVVELHDSGMSWAEIGQMLGLHPQRVSQIARGVTGGVKRRAHPDNDDQL